MKTPEELKLVIEQIDKLIKDNDLTLIVEHYIKIVPKQPQVVTPEVIKEDDDNKEPTVSA
jgi:hypothetical protein